MSIFVLFLYSGYAVGKVAARFLSSTIAVVGPGLPKADPKCKVVIGLR